ncbi:hypothetical protein MMC07_004657 [Pseudocyphellaria aurata]|nr:hypothetical protein [Pseudocyphellaria aurata]
MAFQIMKPNDETPELAPSFGSPPDAEPDNPTALPLEVLRKFRWTFIIRHPRSGIPSLYRLSMPSQREATGWDYFLPSEAGYKELRKLFDFLLSRHVIDRASICLVDADDLLAQPEKITEAYCRSIDVDYKPEMLRWDTDEDDAHVREVFAAPQWQAFHYDAMTSRGLHARKADHTPKSAAELHQSWITEFGTEGAAIIRDTVNANMPDYEYLKSFAMRV